MGYRYFPIQAQIALLLLTAIPALADDKGTLPDILIQAEEKRPIQRTKPAMQFPVKEEEPLEDLLQTEDEVRLKMPSEVSQATRFVTNTWNSVHVAIPDGNFIILAWKGEPAHVFRPLEELSKVYKEKENKELSKAHWELLVVDSAGKPFRKYSGSGLPPEKLEFDGKSDEGNWVRVGLAYTAVLTYQDPQGHSHTALGRTFALAGLSRQQPNGNILIALAAKQLFDADKGPDKLSERGAKLLAEASQLIERHHPGLGISVSARLSRPDPGWVQTAADTCAQELARRLIVAPGSIKAVGQAGTKDLEERVDIVVGDRQGS